MATHPNDQQFPNWTVWLLPHIEGAGAIARALVVVGLYAGAGLLLVWFVAGVISGYLSLTVLAGAGMSGATAETLRRLLGKRKPPDRLSDS